MHYIIYGQSKDATCEDYSRDDSSTGSYISPEMEGVTALTPRQKGCKSDGERGSFLCVCGWQDKV